MPPLNGPPPPLRAESDDETEDTAAEAGHLRSAPDELGRRIDTKRMSSLHLQRELCILSNNVCLERLTQQLEKEDEKGLRRLAELQDKGVCHDWLWKVNPREGSKIAEEDFILALQARLGADVVPNDTA